MLSSLDREKKDHYILTALAKDNPGDVASNRRENSVQVKCGGQGCWGLGCAVSECGLYRRELSKAQGQAGGGRHLLWTATAGAQEDRQSFRELSCANLLLRQPHTGDFGPVCPQ